MYVCIRKCFIKNEDKYDVCVLLIRDRQTLRPKWRGGNMGPVHRGREIDGLRVPRANLILFNDYYAMLNTTFSSNLTQPSTGASYKQTTSKH